MQTFVVRIWAPADEQERHEGDAVQGRLEHVQSGRRAVFHDVEELWRLIGRELRRTKQRAGAPGDQEG